MEKSEVIIRLKRGMYVVNPEFSGVPVSTELIANHLYSPSYVSMHTALRWYGLIPERVAVTQSMTIKHSRSFVDVSKLFEQPYIRPKNLLSDKIKSINTAKKYLSQLETQGVLSKERVGKEFIWFNTSLMAILSD